MRKFLLYILLSTEFLTSYGQFQGQRESGYQYPEQMRIYDSVMAARIQPLSVMPGQLKASLPPMVDNSQNIFFPEILDQYSYFSCQQYSGVAYTYAYEINRLRNAAATDPENQYSTHYTWNFMNDANRLKGVSFFYSWDVIAQQGIASTSDFGPDTASGYTSWMSGYPKYYNAMHNRMKGIHSIPVNTDEGVLTLKNWLFDHLDGSATGGVACFSASSNFVENMVSIPAGLPEEGKTLLLSFYPDATHGMTIVGYNDSIRYDLNMDGKFTNDIDITSDGIIDMKDHEIGAWKIANSYGTWWADQGYFYALYRALALDYDDGSGSWMPDYGIWNHSVYIVDPDAGYSPLLTAKVKITHSARNRIKILAGISTDTAQQFPRYTQEFPIFSFQGGSLPMKGFNEDPFDRQLELGLDITTLLSYAEPGQPSKLFLAVEEKDPSHQGIGTIDQASFIDYTSGIHELSSAEDPVPVQDNGITFIQASGTLNFDKVHITSQILPAYEPGNSYQQSLEAGGGTPPYKWSLIRPVTREETDEPFPGIQSVALHPFSIYIPYAKLALPFAFPFNGEFYDTAYVNAYGFISFDPQMLPYPYLTDEEGMIRRNRVISPAFAINYLVAPQEDRIWAECLPDLVTIRWKLLVQDHESSSLNDFALRLHPDGRFEFLYGDVANQGFTFNTHSGFSAGDGSNYDSWTNWDFNEMSVKSFLFRPCSMPGNISISDDGLLQVSGCDTSVIYQLPLKVTDAKGISSVKNFDFSTGLDISWKIISSHGCLEFGEPTSLCLEVTNITQETIHDLVIRLSTADTSILLADSLCTLDSIGPGSTFIADTSFIFSLADPLQDGRLVRFKLTASGEGHSWEKEIDIPVSALVVEIPPPVIDDGYDGKLDPGEVATLLIRVNNKGSLGISDVNVHLSLRDTLVSILSSPDLVIGNLVPLGSSTLAFQVKGSRFAAPGQLALLKVTLVSQPGFHMEVPFEIRLGRIPVGLVSLYNASFTPAAMKQSFDSLGVTYRLIDSIPSDLDSYASVFLVLGCGPSSHALTQEEGNELAGYLSGMGNLYMEGYHTWYFNNPTAVHSFFNYTSERVTSFTFQDVRGVVGTFTEGIEFPYTGTYTSSLFNFIPLLPAYATMSNPTEEPLEIANPEENYRTIGTFVEFGKLTNGTEPSLKGTLLKKYLEFFGIHLTGPHVFFHSDKNVILPSDSVRFFDDSFDNITSWQWEFPGGVPAVSALKDPVVTYSDFGKFDVKLTVSDGINTASILKKNFIRVIPGVGITEPGPGNHLFIYPNPTEGRIFIGLPVAGQLHGHIYLYDLMGRIILKKEIEVSPQSGAIPLDLSGIGKGMYILQLLTGQESSSCKVIIR